MLVLLILVYGASATGHVFHEIAGLIIYVFFIIHLAYNSKWILNVQRPVNNKTVTQKTKFIYVIDLMLFLVFILTGISGIMISKFIFKFGMVFVWRYIHILSSALSVILLGIHLGLHIKMISSTIRSKYKIINKMYKYICSILFLLIFGIGIYGIVLSINSGVNNNKSEIRSINHHFMEIFDIKDSTGFREKTDIELKIHYDENKNDTFKIYPVIIVSFDYFMIILTIAILTYFIENKIILKYLFKISCIC